jgi:predicted oxidoreductase
MPGQGRCGLVLILLAELLHWRISLAATPTPAQSDIVIVGAGISGLCAALESARAGAKVTVIDMGSVFGGHAVMSSGMVCLVDTPEQRAAHVADSVELASRDFVQFGEDANAEWARYYAEYSRREVYDWLAQLGVKGWELFPQIIPGNSVRRQHVAPGRGVGLVSPIYRVCLRYPNLSFLWNTKATGLTADAGRITGVLTIHQRTGQTNEIRARSVILATGGFESNLQLVRAYWPQYFPALTSGTQILLGSGVNAVGSGLELAEHAGAALERLDHQLFYSTGLPDPRDGNGRRGLHAFNTAAIWVNGQGKRFVRDGAPDPKLQVPAVLRQTPASYWTIFDAAARPRFFVSGSDWNDTNVVQREIFENPKLAQYVKRAGSIAALARAAGLPESTLAATVQEWNQAIELGADTNFHRFELSTAERPTKIQTPPFFAVQCFPLARKSLGGVAVDKLCRVLDKQSAPIPGLYAAGELTGVGGINGKAALEGTMLGPSILMGRVAGRDATSQLPDLKSSPAKVEPEPGTPANRSPTEPESLRAFRDVLRQLITQPRPGYLHFEKVHGVVLARNYDCTQCHGNTQPLALTDEQLDRLTLISACAFCHGGVKEH